LKKWWYNYRHLYVCPIISSKFFAKPFLLNYLKGPQITITPKHLTLKKILVGISGYHYRSIYSKNIGDILGYYSKYLNSVEINHTFYRFPSKNMIYKLSKYNLVYSIKVHRKITHSKKLAGVYKY
jgi:hypothetical protein